MKSASDIKKTTITQETVSNLETAKTKKIKKLESYYELAKIYHKNEKHKNLEKALDNYQFITNNANSETYKEKFAKFSKKTGITYFNIKDEIKDVEDQIDYNNYMIYVKKNTLKGYKEFIKTYPSSNHINDAKNSAYKKACSLNTLKDYRTYLYYFPSHKTYQAKNKAYYKACEINTFATYKQFLIDFFNHKKNDVHEKAFKIVSTENSIKSYNNFLETFKNSELEDEAKEKRDLIVYNNFIGSIKKKNTKEQFIEIDNFIKNNYYFKHLALL